MAKAAKLSRARQTKYRTFASAREEQLFTIAQNDPTPVRVADRAWKKLADDNVEAGYLSCAIAPAGPTYRLTAKGRQKASDGGLI
jgi:hypothetical protein